MVFALAVAFAAASALAPPALAQGESPPLDELALEQMSVRELMRLDTALAVSLANAKLKAQQPKRAQAYPDSHSVLGSSSTPRLLAIYGVGKKLIAEVMVGSRPFVYMHGMALPVGAKHEQTVYRSRGIDGACIALERDDERHTLCLATSVSGG